MSRRFVFLFAAVAFVPDGCSQPAVEVTEAPPTPAVTPQETRLPVAPMPHLPGEREVSEDLTREDPGLDLKIEVALPEIERIDKQTVEAIVTTDPTGTALPGEPPLPDPGGTGTGNISGATFPGRTGATKSKLIREGGGNAESEQAVARGLSWLSKQQKADGSWVFDQGMKDMKAAATGLALLAFLGAGETPTDAKAKYRNVVKAGLEWLVKSCPPDGPTAGRISTDMYEHAIATLALCEAYGMTRDKDLKPAAQAAVDFLQKSQGPDGSWGYTPGNRGDTSIVGWQVQALQAARLTKELKVDVAVLKKALLFLDKTAAVPRKSMYGYTDSTGAKPGTSLTAVGLLCRYYIDGWGPTHPGLIDGVAGLAKNPPPGKGAALKGLYYHYYAAQVMHFYEGEEWKNWNEGPKGSDGTRKGGLRDWLVSTQSRTDGPNAGSWDPEDGFFGTSCGRLGTTAVSVLTLEVYYRHLPLYKRAADGNAVKILEDK